MSVVLYALVAVMLAGTVFSVREVARTRRELQRQREAMRAQLQEVAALLQRHRDDIKVLLHAVVERGVLDEEDLAEIRRRVIELPLRRAEEREELLRSAGIPKDLAWSVDDSDHGNSVH